VHSHADERFVVATSVRIVLSHQHDTASASAPAGICPYPRGCRPGWVRSHWRGSPDLRGPVTQVSRDTVCIGGPDASGECFVKNDLTEDLRVSACVRVTYTPDDSAAYATPTGIEHLDTASHTTDCPRQ
jgi:hypothetical protein